MADRLLEIGQFDCTRFEHARAKGAGTQLLDGVAQYAHSDNGGSDSVTDSKRCSSQFSASRPVRSPIACFNGRMSIISMQLSLQNENV